MLCVIVLVLCRRWIRGAETWHRNIQRHVERTAAIKDVHSADVDGTHLSGPANGHIVVGDGNDGWLPVPGECKPGTPAHWSEEKWANEFPQIIGPLEVKGLFL